MASITWTRLALKGTDKLLAQGFVGRALLGLRFLVLGYGSICCVQVCAVLGIVSAGWSELWVDIRSLGAATL